MTLTVSKKIGRDLVFLVLTGMFVQLGLMGYVFYSAYEGRVDLVESQREACLTRGTVANEANARFQRAHTRYITKVTGAKSVQEDVKKAAREAVKVFRETSTTLTRVANVDCMKAYPKASFFP